MHQFFKAQAEMHNDDPILRWMNTEKCIAVFREWIKKRGRNGKSRQMRDLLRGYVLILANSRISPRDRSTKSLSRREVEKTIEAITAATRTRQIGDGKIFVFPLEHAERIRTGD